MPWSARSVAAMLALTGALAARGAALVPPSAPVAPVVNDYFGVRVIDRYRWMENDRSARFREWIKLENAYAHAVLARIPASDELLQSIAGWSRDETGIADVQVAGGRVVYEKGDKLYSRLGVNRPETLLFDPDAGTGGSGRGSIGYLKPSPDGAYVAVGVVADGSEATELRIIDTASGKVLPERISGAQYASPAWLPDGRSFFYNRLAGAPAGASSRGRYLDSKAYWHRLGSKPDRDTVILAAGTVPGVKITPVDAPVLSTSSDSSYVLGEIFHGAALDETVYVRPLQGVVGGGRAAWRKVADTDDEVTEVALHGDEIFLLTHKNAPRYRILQVSASDPDIDRARKVVAESGAVIEDMRVARDALYLRELARGAESIWRYDYSTGALSKLSLPRFASGVPELATDPLENGALFSAGSWVRPERWYTFEPSRGRPRQVAWDAAPPMDTAGYEFAELRARAEDGTEIPLTLIYRHGLPRDGHRSTLLTVYGAYGVSLTPHFVPGWFALLDRGWLIAVAHVRGGGELGAQWHQDGMLANKPRSYHDFIACAQYLIHQGLTSPANLAIEGDGAGGLVVGMASSARPDLFRAVVSEAADANVLRAQYEEHSGEKALEFGDVESKAGFESLLAVDVVHHVKQGTDYPATMLTVGDDDHEVAPWQTAKWAAALQATGASGRPMILLADYPTDPNADPPPVPEDLSADELEFMLWQLRPN